jgi:isoleucyl-tRNA synthetase
VGEVVRNFTLTLWNVYAFFVTYANLDGWTPGLISQQGDADNPPAYSDLDRWLLSELHTLVSVVSQALENYDVTGATRPIQNFVDDLSKWYLRRSRRRFWKSGSDADKLAAYATLYEALVTLSKLLAPSMPFLAEELHQNLVVSIQETDQAAPESVHLADWPKSDPGQIDEKLNRDMRLVIRLASLGHSARNQAAIKVRQPLSQVDFSVSSRAEVEALDRFADLLADELNVKRVRGLGSAGEAVTYSLKPLPKQLGQKYKSLYPKVAQAIQASEPESTARAFIAGQSVSVQVENDILEIQPDEVEVRAEARPGLVVSTDGPYLAALHTALTLELVQEGLAREFVRRVQDLRKQAGLEIADRIHLSYSASSRLTQAIMAYRSYIMGETLAVMMDEGAAPADAFQGRLEFDGENADVALEKR